MNKLKGFSPKSKGIQLKKNLISKAKRIDINP